MPTPLPTRDDDLICFHLWNAFANAAPDTWLQGVHPEPVVLAVRHRPGNLPDSFSFTPEGLRRRPTSDQRSPLRSTIWIFHGDRARHACGVFDTLDAALAWAAEHQVTGNLAENSFGGACDVAVSEGPLHTIESTPWHRRPRRHLQPRATSPPTDLRTPRRIDVAHSADRASRSVRRVRWVKRSCRIWVHRRRLVSWAWSPVLAGLGGGVVGVLIVQPGAWLYDGGVTPSRLPAAVGGRWAGPVVEVEVPVRPCLRVEVAGGRRLLLLLRQDDRVVLLGRQRAMHRGVYYARTGRYRSPIPPITAALARRLRASSEDEESWAARWTHQFTGWLQAGVDGPLHTGRWMLAWGMPRWAVTTHWQRLRVVDPDQGHITWFGYGDPDEDQRDVLPLRRLSAVDAGRVRSYRRQYREGVLPPVLLWWVSGLQTLLVLDGHDRVTAALAEHVVPDVLVLAPAADLSWISSVQHRQIREHQGRLDHLQALADQGDQMAKAHLTDTTRRFAADLADIVRSEGRTRAWPMPRRNDGMGATCGYVRAGLDHRIGVTQPCADHIAQHQQPSVPSRNKRICRRECTFLTALGVAPRPRPPRSH
ncbi:hypothetical protein E1193_00660 [Micromonospora sp. KC606]|uniref:DUF7710 domain-containing protein n=1 Tax=Micromonospora sp. KC606 TaxID=2530379 RepID=UPI0010486671|nr:hypothetical protein [Micromonospora sp. KC606]TDC86199.1 hypothetical protein E1193_00660 [Micromonospora sp. KC606]